MKLHENIALFEQAVRTTAQQKGLLEIYIEKDYWVTLAYTLNSPFITIYPTQEALLRHDLWKPMVRAG